MRKLFPICLLLLEAIAPLCQSAAAREPQLTGISLAGGKKTAWFVLQEPDARIQMRLEEKQRRHGIELIAVHENREQVEILLDGKLTVLKLGRTTDSGVPEEITNRDSLPPRKFAPIIVGTLPPPSPVYIPNK